MKNYSIFLFLLITLISNLNCSHLETKTNITATYTLTPLIQAVIDNNLDQTKKILASPDLDINTTDKYGKTALFHAAELGHCEILQELLKFEKLDITKADSDKFTPLMAAIDKSNIEACEILLHEIRRQQNIYNSNKSQLNEQLRAAIFGESDEIAKVLAHDIRRQEYLLNIIEARDKADYTPLMRASVSGNKEIVDLLLTHRANFEATTTDKKTGDIVTVAQLAQKRIDNQGLQGENIAAEAHGRLIENTKDFINATVQNDLEQAQLYLTNGLVTAQASDDTTPMLAAIRINNIKLIKLLIQNGINVNTANSIGLTPLMAATLLNKTKIVKLLLRHKADPNLQDKNGIAALHVAQTDQHTRIAELLIMYGADIKIADKYNATPLDRCVVCNILEIAKILIKAGADVNHPFQYPLANGTLSKKLHCLDVAHIYGYQNMYDLLCQAGADYIGLDYQEYIKKPAKMLTLIPMVFVFLKMHSILSKQIG